MRPSGCRFSSTRVARLRLDDQPRAVGRERRVHVCRRRGRVAEVVQRVEARDEVVALAREVRRRRDLEPDAVLDARRRGVLPGALDRLDVVVEADERRARERLGQQHRRGPVAAADVGDAGARPQLGLDALERRDPVLQQVRAVGEPEHRVRPVEQIVMVLVPAETVAAAEAVGHVVLRVDHRARGLEHAALVHRAGLVGQHGGVLDRQRVGARLGVVVDVAAGRLGREPLADVALVRPGALGQLGRAHRLAVGHRGVQAEPRADHGQRHVHGGADLVDDAIDERFDAGLVDHHAHVVTSGGHWGDREGTGAGAPVPEDS